MAQSVPLPGQLRRRPVVNIQPVQAVQPLADRDPVLVHQFIRLVGRPPTADELLRYREVRTRAVLRRPGRLRRTAARLITRW